MGSYRMHKKQGVSKTGLILKPVHEARGHKIRKYLVKPRYAFSRLGRECAVYGTGRLKQYPLRTFYRFQNGGKNRRFRITTAYSFSSRRTNPLAERPQTILKGFSQ